MNQRKEDTALGVARARFVDSLSRKAEEIEAAVRAVSASPDDASAREDLRKRFHALYASAQVFRIQGLAEALKGCLVVIDEARDQSRALEATELSRLREVLGSLGELATGQRPSIIPNMDDAVENTRYSAPRPSALGLPPAHRPPSPVIPAAKKPSSPGIPAAPPRPVSSPGIPAAKKPSSPGIPTAPPRPVSSPGIPAAKKPSSPGIPAAKKPSSPGIPAAKKPSSPGIPSARPLSTGSSSAKSSAFVPRSGSSVPPPSREKRLVASRAAVAVEVDRLLCVLMVGGEPIAQRLSSVLPKGRVELVQTANEREALDSALECSPDVVVVAPSFAPLVAGAFAEAGLELVPRVQLTPPGASASDYQLPGVTTVVAVNAPPSKLAKTIVETAAPLGARRVTPHASTRSGGLEGAEVVVAFDEPGLTHFIARELERAGATVYRASDGERALALVRAARPDALLTCAELPGLAGAELVLRVERDPHLTRVRAFVLEIDDELRAKMRAVPEESEARVEAGGGFIVDVVADARANARRALEALRGGHPHRGRVRGVGALALLEALEAARADARLELRDTERTLEIELRSGRPVTATFTTSSGEFLRGDRAFERLAAVVAGRFRLSPADGEPKGPPVAEGASAKLETETLRRSVLLELLEGGSLPGETQLTLDADLAAAAGLDETLTRALGESKTIHSITTLLGPERARERLLALAREGAVTGLSDGAGANDLVAEGLARRGEPIGEAADALTDTTPGSVTAVEAEEEIEAEEVAIESVPPAASPPAEAVVAAPPAPAEAVVAAPPTPPAPIPLPEPSEAALPSKPEAPPPLPRPRVAEAPPIDLDQPPPRRSRGWAIALVATFVVAGAGFAAVELFGGDSRGGSASGEESEGVAEERAAVAPAPEEPKEPALVDPFPAIARFYGERREGVAGAGVQVPRGHGLVVVEAPEAGPSPEVLVGAESLGKAPVSKAFPPGRVEITFVRGGEKSFRYVFVEPGVTRVLPGR